MNNAPTRRADPGECDVRILTPLPAPRVPLIAYEDHVDYLPAREDSPTWEQRGTELHAPVTLPDGTACLAVVETISSGSDDVEPLDVSIYRDGCFGKDRYVPPVDELVGFYDQLRKSAKAEVQRRATELIEAHEELRDNESAERARDAEEMYA